MCIRDRVRNATEEDTTHKREDSPSEAMLSITVDQVMTAVKARLARPIRGSASHPPVAKNELGSQSPQQTVPGDGGDQEKIVGHLE